jgi:glyoxylase-like metal-dependent hydrolase (beta-lactamase superfamily II)
MRGPLVYVYAYALEAAGGLLLVDTGWDGDDAFDALEAGLGTFGASVANVNGALFTHAHIDHYGLANRVRDASGAWLAMHEREAETLLRPAGDESRARMERWLLENGVDRQERDELFAAIARGYTDGPAGSAPPDRNLEPGSIHDAAPWELLVVETPGHSPGHLCFVEQTAGVVFTGDHILSETTPNVSVFPSSTGSPLDDYITSLERMAPYADALALPGHEDRIQVGPRATVLLQHHSEQLADAHAALVAGAETVREVAEAMTWSRPWSTFGPFDQMMALGEARAHLVLIEQAGEASSAGRGDVIVWSAAVSRRTSAARHRM